MTSAVLDKPGADSNAAPNSAPMRLSPSVPAGGESGIRLPWNQMELRSLPLPMAGVEELSLSFQQQQKAEGELQQRQGKLLQEQQLAATLQGQLQEARQQVQQLEQQLLQEQTEKSALAVEQQAQLLAAQAGAKQVVEASKKVSRAIYSP